MPYFIVKLIVNASDMGEIDAKFKELYRCGIIHVEVGTIRVTSIESMGGALIGC